MVKTVVFLLHLNFIFVLASAQYKDNIYASYNHIKEKFTCPEKWGTYSDPENCIKFYTCENGKPETHTCYTGK